MKRLPTLPLLLLAVALFPAAACGQDAAWPMFRGEPALRGLATGTLPAAPQLLWTYAAGGPVRSSAAIAGGLAFLGSLDGTVHAIDTATGKKVWSYKAEDEIEATPLVYEGTVYVGSADTNFYAFDAKTGALRWKTQTGDKILGAANWLRDTAGRMLLQVGAPSPDPIFSPHVQPIIRAAALFYFFRSSAD